MVDEINLSAQDARRRPPFECIALVLQGGGALGAYQAGVYQGLAEAGLEPDWIAGISIGAINAAIIAGNPPEARVERLRQFWEPITSPHPRWATAGGTWMLVRRSRSKRPTNASGVIPEASRREVIREPDAMGTDAKGRGH